MNSRTHILALVFLVALTEPLLQARDVTLPEPAVPGLRYYYPPAKVAPRVVETDVCIYGGTCAGVVAAVQADRMGQQVVLLEFGKHLGGLSSGGLSHTDGGDPAVCGGIAREFYKLIGQRNFRPSEAEAAFEKLLEPTKVVVHKLAHLDKVEKDGSHIVSITMEDGLTVRAKQFIDATYEGDLLARAGVSWHAGREANSVYKETYNGIRTPGTGGHNWPVRVDPYRIAGDPSSGLLPRVNNDPGKPGVGDDRIQAFCFRMWLTKDDPLPFPKPTVYEEEQYELLARLFESGADPKIRWSLDTNNHHLFNGAYFIDFVGGNYGWPDASWIERERIFQAHANYQIGVMWFLANSDRIPEPHRSQIRQWGLPRDEYVDTSGWTHQLYIREGRRMVSDYLMTQHNCQGREVPEDSVGLASYNMDSHHCQMTVVDGAVRNEGNVEIPVEPYRIAYRALTPKRGECTNLLVPVALSSSHIAFGSIRMEPVFMLLGQSAATAAAQAIDADVAVQDVDYAKLSERLLKDGQILEYTGPPRHRGSGQTGIDAKTLLGVVVDNDNAELAGPWQTNNVTHPRVGPTYVHDNNEAKGKCVAKYRFKLPEPGRYEVRVSWPPNPNRATNVPITIRFGRELKTVMVNQKNSGRDGFNSLGEYLLGETAVVEISNKDTAGYVIADAVQLLPVRKEDRSGSRQDFRKPAKDRTLGGFGYKERPNILLPHWPIIEIPDDKTSGKQASLSGMIAYMDKLCGRIVGEIDRLGIADNTIVIFMGDNGTDSKTPRKSAAGEVKGGKTDLNDAGTHIPLLVRWPGKVKAKAVADDLIDMADLFPTICELAGVKIPSNVAVDGVSFAGRW